LNTLDSIKSAQVSQTEPKFLVVSQFEYPKNETMRK
jgi:hypothetical protein